MAYRKIRTRLPTPAPRVMVGGAIAFVALISAWLWMSAPAEPARRRSTETFASANARIAPPGAAVSRKARPARVVYRNSVLPGGVASAADLSSALAHDPVAAAHYAGFNVAAARTVRVERARMAHVSYRIGDKIYWTKKPVRIALGETLLSDGEHLARGRCGNRISDQAQAPVLLNEPDPEVLELAFVSAESLIDAPPDAAPRADVAATAQAADAQQATPTRSMPSFVFSSMPGSPSPSSIEPTRILALTPPPTIELGGEPSPTPPPKPETPSKTPPPPRTPDSPPPKSPAPDSPPPKSPAPDSPPPGSPPPPSPPPTTPQPLPNPPTTIPRAPTPIPEPGSAALFGLGLAIFLLIGRRRRGKLHAAGRN